MLRILLHDYDEQDLTTTTALLTNALDTGEVCIENCVSRNAYLRLISQLPTSPPRALAMVDLRKHESRDQEFAGLRIIESIAHHPDLRLRAIPMALTRHRYNEIQTALNEAGCAAAIDKRALEDESDVLAYLEEVLDHPEPAEHTPWLPERDGHEHNAAEVFDEVFPGLPLTTNRLAILALDMQAHTDEGIAAEMGVAVATVRKNLRQLREHAQSGFAADEKVALTLAAQELFERAPHAAGIAHAHIARMRGLEADLSHVASPTRVRPLWETPRIVRNAWLAPDGRPALTRALATSRAKWTDCVGALELADRAERQSFARSLTRAVLALVDADADLRRYPSEGVP